MAHNFKAGDKVKLLKGDGRSWSFLMDFEVGQVATIKRRLPSGEFFETEESGFNWHRDWLEIMEPAEANSNCNTVTNELGARQSYLAARFDCIPPECLKLLAECLGYGARKYGQNNWQNISLDDNLSHAMNHINEWRRGDRGEPHLVNAIARLNFALWLAVQSGDQPETYIHPEAT